MKITRETDYAIRIVSYLSKNYEIVGANKISQDIEISKNFALKILRKLSQANILESYKGNLGGYKIAKDPKFISMKDVIEATNGVIAINDCLEDNFCCNANSCNYLIKEAFLNANNALIKELQDKTFDKLQ